MHAVVLPVWPGIHEASCALRTPSGDCGNHTNLALRRLPSEGHQGQPSPRPRR